MGKALGHRREEGTGYTGPVGQDRTGHTRLDRKHWFCPALGQYMDVLLYTQECLSVRSFFVCVSGFCSRIGE